MLVEVGKRYKTVNSTMNIAITGINQERKIVFGYSGKGKQIRIFDLETGKSLMENNKGNEFPDLIIEEQKVTKNGMYLSKCGKFRILLEDKKDWVIIYDLNGFKYHGLLDILQTTHKFEIDLDSWQSFIPEKKGKDMGLNPMDLEVGELIHRSDNYDDVYKIIYNNPKPIKFQRYHNGMVDTGLYWKYWCRAR